ncbi:MAG: aspartate aminotransferase family protein [Thermoguttaceae bacterium]|nr:aspartate aminotransferase family protein [Thermoguttaceae bacterium]
MSRNTQEILALFKDYVIPNYTRYPVVLVRGEGSFVWDADGNRYIDFFPGWGCNMFGHCPKPVVEAVQQQVARLIHVPNSWYTEEQGLWAKLLSERSFGGQAFFCNSGAEANEAAIKLVRLHSPKGKYKIVTYLNSFHGRTMGAVSATGQAKYHQGLEPLLPGFTYVPYGDLAATEAAIDDETAAIMVEPIQGEGGVQIPPDGFLQGLRDLCDKNNLLLIFDEVQTGCGRTGEWFAYQYFGVTPDIMTLAKTICSGIAGAAMLAKKEIAPDLRPGMHAATFGGNPIAAAAGIATIKMVENEGLLDKGKKLGAHFRERLTQLQKDLDIIQDVRVAGAMIGIELRIEGAPFVKACMEKGFLINCTHGNIIRLLPAVNTPLELADQGLDILEEALRKGSV